MRFEQFKSVFRSLRFRLSAWNTAAVLLIVVVTLIGVREAMRFTLMTENDQLLMDDAHEVGLAVESYYPDLDEVQAEMDRKAAGHLDRQLFVQLFDPRGDILFDSGLPPDLKALSPAAADKPALVTVDDFRVASRLVTKSGVPLYTVRVGASLAIIHNDMAQLSQLMMAAGIVILFVAPLSGFFLAGRATRPWAASSGPLPGCDPATWKNGYPFAARATNSTSCR